MSALLELDDYLEEHKPDIMGITETKLSDAFKNLNIDGGRYNIWKRNKKYNQRGVVMVF